MDKKRFEEIYSKLPSKWEEVTVQDFIRCSPFFSNVSETDDDFLVYDNHVKVLAALSNMPVDELELLSLSEMNKLGTKIDFMIVPPQINKTSTIKWKSVSEITYGNYVAFQQLGGDFFNNIHILLPAFANNEMTAEDVLKMNMVDATTGFFLLSKHTRKYLKRTIFFLRVKMILLIIKEKTQLMFSKMKSMLQRKKNKQDTAGTS